MSRLCWVLAMQRVRSNLSLQKFNRMIDGNCARTERTKANREIVHSLFYWSIVKPVVYVRGFFSSSKPFRSSNYDERTKVNVARWLCSALKLLTHQMRNIPTCLRVEAIGTFSFLHKQILLTSSGPQPSAH